MLLFNLLLIFFGGFMFRFTYLVLFVVFTNINLYSQLSLNSSNWKAEPGIDSLGGLDINIINQVLAIDKEFFYGDNIDWELPLEVIGNYYDKYGQPNNQTFQDASYYIDSLFDVLAAYRGVFRKDYYKKSEEGIFIQGYEYDSQSYFIGDLTGGPGDSLSIGNYSKKYENAFQLYNFPVSAGYSHTDSYIRDLNTSMTIMAYGLNSAPASKRSYVTLQDTVVGWGTAKLIALGKESANNEVLIIKRKIIYLDSIFLYGQPAPAAFLSAFNLQQGAVTEVYRYIMLSSNLRAPMMVVSFTDENMNVCSSATMNLSVLINPTSVEDNSIDSPLSIFPNPSHDFLNVNLPNDETISSIQILNSLGSIVYEVNNIQKINSNHRIDISNLEIGMYFIKIGNKVSKFIKH